MAGQAFQFGFANPQKYSDWAAYAGLDRNTGGFAPPSAGAPVKPPGSFSEFFNQPTAGIQNAMTGVKNTFSNLGAMAGQFGQGDFKGAFGTAQNLQGAPVMPQTGAAQPGATPAAQQRDPYDYTKNLDDDEAFYMNRGI